MKEQLIEFVHTFISERGHDICKEDMMTCSFKSDVALDSFEILSLVMHVELKFGVKLEPKDLIEPETDSIEGFISMILAKLA